MEIARYYGSRISFYFDLHAHSQVTNTFVFRNEHPDPKIAKEILVQ
jgi:hypothetical protein